MTGRPFYIAAVIVALLGLVAVAVLYVNKPIITPGGEYRDD